MKIALLGNYPPKACGIATFTNSLARALHANLTAAEIADFCEIIAIEDPGDHNEYPKEVGCILPRDERNAYVSTAEYLNRGGFDLLIVQHEYGIFGGPDGEYLLSLTDRLRIPLMVTCHTVLKQPSEGQCSVMRRLSVRAQVMVVMSQMAKRFMETVYKVPSKKVQVIEHGVPEIEMDGRDALREKFGWSEDRVLFTFGLLGRGKGIETVIRALPAIVAENPKTKYIVLGKTHPNVIKHEGEAYREELYALAEELGVGEHLEMVSEFATEQHLFECLRATDAYVIPYPNEAQITSGTLAYAVGAGAAVVSTPFWHAQELLAEGRGRLFGFHDADDCAAQVLDLLNDQATLDGVRAAAAAYGQTLLWPRIGAEYIDAFGTACIRYERMTASPYHASTIALYPSQPPNGGGAPAHRRPTALRLEHLYRMTDDCGLVQHAKYSTPNRFEGYCLDDNGRALVFTCLAHKSNLSSRVQRRKLESLTDTYLAYVYHAQHEDGCFRNFMSFGHDWLENEGSEDSYGRALWGLATCVRYPPRPDQASLANECFIRAIGHLDRRTSPRTLAYGVIALSDYLLARDDQNLRDLLHRTVNRLLDHYRDNRHDDWEWFEAYLTYDNALLPLALYRSLDVFPNEEVRGVAASTKNFLLKQTLVGHVPRPVGCHDFCPQGEEPGQFDQQPLEVLAEVLLHKTVYDLTGQQLHAERAHAFFSWFLGNNDLGAPLYDARTYGVYDGLTKLGPNRNQGAESLLAYLISQIMINEVPNPKTATKKTKRQALKRMLNGYAPRWVDQGVPVGKRKVPQDAETRLGIVSATALGHYSRDVEGGFHCRIDYPI